jgi:hypothetical protein
MLLEGPNDVVHVCVPMVALLLCFITVAPENNKKVPYHIYDNVYLGPRVSDVPATIACAVPVYTV